MPSSQYLKLTDQQRKKIFESSLVEFGKYGYESASTNRIVKRINISKGSIFKYFGNKKNLFLYVCQQCADRLIQFIISELDKIPKGFFEALIYLAMCEIHFYQKNPDIFYLFLHIKNDPNHPVHTTVLANYQLQYEEIYERINNQLNTQEIRSEISSYKVMEIVKWVIEGFQKKSMSSLGTISDFEGWKEFIYHELDLYFSILKCGIYAPKERS